MVERLIARSSRNGLSIVIGREGDDSEDGTYGYNDMGCSDNEKT